MLGINRRYTGITLDNTFGSSHFGAIVIGDITLHQVIVAAISHGSGSEQDSLLPMVEQSAPYRTKQTLITADAGYHSEANLKALYEQAIPALIADGLMRKRDPRFADQGKY